MYGSILVGFHFSEPLDSHLEVYSIPVQLFLSQVGLESFERLEGQWSFQHTLQRRNMQITSHYSVVTKV
jgi:hypothetical protein